MKSELEKAVWTTKDGRKIRIKDMTHDHLLNTITYLRKWARLIRIETLRSISKDVKKGNPDACMLHDVLLEHGHETDEVLKYCVSAWNDLFAEAKKRGLLDERFLQCLGKLLKN